MNQSYKAITEAYAEYLQTLGFAASTVYYYPRMIAGFLVYMEQQGIYQVKQITTRAIFSYYSYLEQTRGEKTKQPFSAAYLNKHFLAVDKFMEFLHHSGVEDAPPPPRYLVENERKKPLQVLTPEEIQTLYDVVPYTFPDMTFAIREPRQMTVKLVLDLCYGCGLRKSEALNIKLNDVNLDQKILHVQQGKNYKDRFVPLSKGIYKSIYTFIYQYRRCLNFTNRSGYLYPFKDTAIAEALEMLVKNCDKESIRHKKPTLHTLRHSIATHLLQNGMDVENIARFLGHGTLESTQLYTHIINDQL